MRTDLQVDPQCWRNGTMDGRPIRDVLAARDVGAIFRYLSSRGWSRSALAAATGMAETRVRQLMQGRQEVHSYLVLERVATGFAIPRGWMGLAFAGDESVHEAAPHADDRITAGETDSGWLTDPSAAPLPWTATGGLLAAHAVTDAGGMERRNLLVLLGAAATSTAHEWLIARSAPDMNRPAGRPVPPGVVDHLDEIAAHLRRMDDQLGGGSLLALVRQQVRSVINLLDERRYTETVGKRLHTTLAELLRLAGWLSFDTGQHAGAQRYWAAGLHAAHAAGDRALGANILGFLSCQAKDLGHVRDAITLAETALAGYPGATPRVTAILELRAAEAHANEGDPEACRPRIDAAFERLRDNAASTGEPGWCYWLDETHAHGQAGYSYLRLGDWERARSHLQMATRIQAPAYAREAALRHVLLAQTYVRQDHPDLDEAVRLGNLAVDALDGEVDSSRCVGHVQQLSTALTPYASRPAVRELRERAHLLTAAGTPTA